MPTPTLPKSGRCSGAEALEFFNLSLPRLQQRPLVDTTERSFAYFVAADHDGAGRGHLERPRDPPLEQARQAFCLEDVPQQTRHRPLFGGLGGNGTRRGGGRSVSVDLCPRLANIERRGRYAGEGARCGAGHEAVSEGFSVVLPTL